MTKIVLVDDHILLRDGLSKLIEGFGNYRVLFQANNGKDFIEKLKSDFLPDLVLLDINMPEMDGFTTSLWLKDNYPIIKILALSMYDNETSIIKMFKAGAKGYILKDCDPHELRNALSSIISKGFYYSEMVTGKLINNVAKNYDNTSIKKYSDPIEFTEREITFLKLSCTELTYKEIAAKMFVSPRTVDGYRDDLFAKLNIKTRVGLVMYCIKNGMVTP